MQAFDAEHTGYATYARRNKAALARERVHVRRFDIRGAKRSHVRPLIFRQDEEDVRLCL